MTPEQFAALRQKYPKFNEPWSGEDIELLTQYTQEGMSLDEMSNRLQRSKKAVRMRQQAMGIYTPKPVARLWSAEDDQTLKSMYTDGVSFEEIAENLGRTVNSIVARLVRLRMPLFKAEG